MSESSKWLRRDVWMQLRDPGKLAKLMQVHEVSTRDLATAANWRSHSYLCRLLRGEVKTLKVEPAVLIAERLSVPVDVLFVTRVDTRHVQKKRKKVAA